MENTRQKRKTFKREYEKKDSRTLHKPASRLKYIKINSGGNHMKLVNSYNAVTITSALTRAQIMTLKRFNPAALSLYEDKKPVFAIDYHDCATPDISPIGIIFTCTDADDQVYAPFAECMSGATTEEKKDYLKEMYGPALAKLQQVEVQALTALRSINELLSSVESSIEVS